MRAPVRGICRRNSVVEAAAAQANSPPFGDLDKVPYRSWSDALARAPEAHATMSRSWNVALSDRVDGSCRRSRGVLRHRKRMEYVPLQARGLLACLMKSNREIDACESLKVARITAFDSISHCH